MGRLVVGCGVGSGVGLGFGGCVGNGAVVERRRKIMKRVRKSENRFTMKMHL